MAVAAARAVIVERRAELEAGAAEDADLVARARERLERARRPSLRRVLNATGVVVHTNLGRAPLSAAAVEAVVGAGRTRGVAPAPAKGRRSARVSRTPACRLARPPQAGAALVVNDRTAGLGPSPSASSLRGG